MDRRAFINKAKIISAGSMLLPSFLLGCEKEDSFSLNQESKIYIPQVNSQPYFSRRYHLEKKISGNSGVVDAFFKQQEYALILEDENHNLISGLEGIFYGEEDYGTKMFSISDPQKRYLPNIYSFSDKKGLPFITMLDKIKGDISQGGIGFASKHLFIREIKEGLPSWDADNICKYPGMVYLGDWSFNNIKQLNTNLKRGSLIFSFIPGVSVANHVFSAVGSILDGLDILIDSINSFTSLNIDKNKQYPFYQIPFDDTQVLIYLGERFYCSQQPGNINTLLPLVPGNNWVYTDNRGNIFDWTVKGIKNINGKDLLYTENLENNQEYFGFNGKTLAQYGVYDSEIGNIFFDPPLKMGDDNIFPGTKYNISSKIICEDYPEITGKAEGTVKFESKESIVLPNLKPYGDCFRAVEDSNITLKKQGQSPISSNVSGLHWFSKNIGKVKMRLEGREFYLVDSLINEKSTRNYSVIPSFSQKVLETIKELI